jgi:predicted Zn-dependent peptidase
MEYKTLELENGLRLIHLHSDSQVAHCGIFINTGSRDENNNQSGIVHFIEHAVFKGTYKRKAFHIINCLEDVGGELDAYTAKEKTVFYATFLNQYYEKAIDLLSDIVFNPSFPQKEIDKEKDVILDEINSYLDNPSELIFDDFEQYLYPNHSIGRPILGTPDSILNYSSRDIFNFVREKYNSDNIIICSVGNIDFTILSKLFNKYFGNVVSNPRKFRRKKVAGYLPFSKEIEKNSFQAHCIIGNIAYDMNDKRRLGLVLLNNILGGSNMNSRLNMVLRERYGLVYNVESSCQHYTDTGFFNVYFGTDKNNLEKAIGLVYKEFEKIKTQKLSVSQLQRAKTQIIGQLIIASDSNINQLFTIGKSYLLFNKVASLKSLIKKIEGISSIEILDIANQVLEQNNLSRLIYK